MTAVNHALTGALIGLLVTNPFLAIPLALISHVPLDAIPHFDFPGTELQRIRSDGFLYFMILGNAILCLVLVLLLAARHPEHWLTAVICAFVAAMPDLLSLPKYIAAKLKNKLAHSSNRFQRWHQTTLQWKTGPQFWWVETIWFLVFGTVVVTRL